MKIRKPKRQKSTLRADENPETIAPLVERAISARKRVSKMDRHYVFLGILFMVSVWLPWDMPDSLVYPFARIAIMLLLMLMWVVSSVLNLYACIQSLRLSNVAVGRAVAGEDVFQTLADVESCIDVLSWTRNLRKRAAIAQRLQPHLDCLAASIDLNLSEPAVRGLRRIARLACNPRDGYPCAEIVTACLRIIAAAGDTEALPSVERLAVESGEDEVRNAARECAAQLMAIRQWRTAPQSLLRASTLDNSAELPRAIDALADQPPHEMLRTVGTPEN